MLNVKPTISHSFHMYELLRQRLQLISNQSQHRLASALEFPLCKDTYTGSESV